ncbi:tRNA (cytidine(34)-2'-O)-methyltransferase [Natronospirillum operosum]|uniref:tRNA (cytidine(34)-2'-O)-methyltransferase n=1 Tax=Natronospirillum operosum TaxID=2759953 RepID=A0A4Z0WCP7_9GAMM|nr:tRNA (cytidine(34)-2'-O)-methyltransferase [Natronospirillum operosum]TGG92354.1 tRNA (cytidine(34)-2'-O)-methyltransferase [Natronospirillum operosum]
MFNLILYEPEIPPNTGNIIRLCANTGCSLHLIEPLGFRMEDKALRRAGLDYHEWAQVRVHPSYDAFLTAEAPLRIWMLTTRAEHSLFEAELQPGDCFLFGPETRGLPDAVLGRQRPDTWRRLPMQPQGRSLNLSNAAAVVAYEAWRQIGFTALPRGE